MIADSLRNKNLYKGISSELALALDYLQNLHTSDFIVQTIEIDGRRIYAMYQSYTTESAEGRQYEAHRRYIDIQYILEGEEVILAADLAGMTAQSDYNDEKDIQWFMPGTDAGSACAIHLRAGQFGVFFPQDAHMPKLAAGSPGQVKKVVVKVAVQG